MKLLTCSWLNDLSTRYQSGVVQVNRPLDRERVAEYRLTITVKDNPENFRIARRVNSPLSAATATFHSSSFTENPLNFKLLLPSIFVALVISF